MKKIIHILVLFMSLGGMFFLNAQTVISVPADATSVEKKSAEELGSYLEMIFGRKFQVKQDDPSACIRVGTFQKKDAAPDLGDDGFEIISDGTRLSIRGGTRDGSGNRYGVYDFLERIGCRFMSSQDEFIPRRKDFVIPALSIRQKPGMPLLRWVIASGVSRIKLRTNGMFDGGKRYKGFGYPMRPEDGICRQFIPYNSHTSLYFMPPEKYASKHPEYYAVRNGRRHLDPDRAELCFSNPAMQEEFIRNCREFLKKAYRKGIVLVISPQDHQHFCQCAECSRINREEKTGGGTLVRFINRLAEALEKDYPDLLIKAGAYQYYRFPPALTSYHRNVAISLANIECDFAKAYTGAKLNEEFCRLMKQWKKRCSHLFLMDYGTTFDNYLLPLPNFDALSERIRGARALGCSGACTINAHTGPGGEFSELRNYLTARLYWDPDADPWVVAEDFCRHYYGKGGRPILDYLRFYHQHLKDKNAEYYFLRQPELLYDEAFVERAERAFREAYAAVGNDPVIRTRLDRSYTTVQMMRVLLLARLSPGSKELHTAVDRLEAACRRFGIQAQMERANSIKVFFAKMRFTLREVPDFCRGKKWTALLPSAYIGRRAKICQDPLAESGVAVKMSTDHNSWLIYLKTAVLPGFNSPLRYDAYVKVRIIPEEGADPETPAFEGGVCFSAKEYTRKTIKLKECAPDGYRYFKIAEHFPITEKGYVWIAPKKNPKQIQEIRADHFLFVLCE